MNCEAGGLIVKSGDLVAIHQDGRVSDVEACGGLLGLPCASGTCIDDPRDDCDPSSGGADCIGICSETGGK